MNSVERWLLEYLVNSLWQVPLLLAVGLLSALILRACGPAVQHRVWVTVLLAQAILPACRLNPLPWLRLLLAAVNPQADSQPGQVTIQIGPGLALGSAALPPWLLASLTVAYGIAILFCAARLCWGLRRTASLRRSATPAALPAQAREFAALCQAEFHRRDAEILSSPCVPGPIALGMGHPAIILPEGMLGRVTDEELNAALAHEFAHVCRRDYTWNLVYQALTLPLLYHPAFWLTRTRLTESREILCDRLAADLLRSPQVYARSLVRLAALLLDSHPVSISHAIGIFDAHSFERRVMHLTRIQPTAKGLRAAMLFGVALSLGLGTCASALALRAIVLPVAAPAHKMMTARQAGAVKISAGVMAGQIVSKTQPVYPPDAKEAHISGAVVLHAIIGKDGAVQDLTVISGPPELQASALDAVKQWVYKPYLLNGEPTEVETTITVNYSFANL